MHLDNIVGYLDRRLRCPEIGDFPTAFNGLQVANSGGLSKIGAAVDACEYVLVEAAAAGVDLLLVHHGMFWGGNIPIVGAGYRKLRVAMDADMAIYSAHLPLDMHPEIGNNALLAEAAGLVGGEPFLEVCGSPIGLRFSAELNREVLREHVQRAVNGPVHLAPGGPIVAREIGVVTGGGGSEIARVAAAGVDTLITGEGPHWTFTAAEELGVNLYYAGHYATEVFGVQALAQELSAKFGLPWQFFDHPTGL